MALAFTAKYPERVLSLALSEPAVIPSQMWIKKETTYWQRMKEVMKLPQAERMREFMWLELHDDVPMPSAPTGNPPAWMATRPAGVKALVEAFDRYDMPYDQLKKFSKPVYITVAGLSNPIEMRKAEALQQIFPDIQVEVYAERHHFDPPQRVEPECFARALHSLWKKAATL